MNRAAHSNATSSWGCQPDARQPPPAAIVANPTLARQVSTARDAQQRWHQVPLRQRLRLIRNFRHQLVERTDVFLRAVTYAQRQGPTETLAAELIPLADACRFLEREAPRILAVRRLGRRSRPLWLPDVTVELRRDPVGIVLIVAAANYPIFLAGVQTLQALAAGNGVLLKPGVGASQAARALHDALAAAGMEPALVQVLPEPTPAVRAALDAGVDKLVLTGSADTGRHLLSQLSQTLTPATMELSGCDAVFVLPDADLDRLVRCLAFGLRFNGGATCMAPRRVFVPWALKQELESRLRQACSRLTLAAPPILPESIVPHLAAAIDQGARLLTESLVPSSGGHAFSGPVILTDARPEMQLLRTDVLFPLLSLVPVASIEDALLTNSQCPFALGAAVFGGARSARQLAGKIDAGCVVINDLIAPTADPRVPLASRRQSGFGVTRGAAGLEQMTLLKAIVHRRGNWLAHLDETTPWDARLLADFLGLVHGRGWRKRLGHACSAVRTAINQRKWKKSQQHAGRKVDVG